jgi:hydroxymethylbilane synthase
MAGHATAANASARAAGGREVTRLVLGTRGSALALAQVDLTEAALAKVWPVLETTRQIFVTRGDQKLDLNLLQKGDGGGKGLFTRELEHALLDGVIDVAVHSMKDLPGHNPPGLEIAAVLERAPIADTLVSKLEGGLAALPQGAIVGTSSIRRARQLGWHRPDLRIEEWRGNVQTRLRKLGERPDVTAIVLAEAGLRRLHYTVEAGRFACEGGQFFAHSLADILIPAIGQGAVALQIRADRADVAEVLASINHAPTMLAIRAEREVQRVLAGDCSVPIGVRTELDGTKLKLRGILFKEPGEPPILAEAEGTDPEAVARELCAQLNP